MSLASAFSDPQPRSGIGPKDSIPSAAANLLFLLSAMHTRTLSALYQLLSILLFVPSVLPAAPAAPPADVVSFAGLSAADAASKATLPPGFKMHVFAAEPEVVQPIAFCLDHRGRVWVAEGITYPRRKGHPPKTDAAFTTPTAEQLSDILGGADRI